MSLLCASLVLLPTLASAARGKKEPPPPPPPAAKADTEEVESIDVAEATPATEGDDWFGDAYPQFDRIIDHYTDKVTRTGEFETIVQHRASEGLLRHPFQDFLGFDPGALKIGLGVRYGAFEWFDFGIYRINGTVEVFDTYELDARYQILAQQKHKVDLAVRAGLSWFAQPSSNAGGFFLQANASRLIYNRAIVGGGLLFHSNSSGPTKQTNDATSSTALMLQTEVRLSDSWSMAAEITIGGLAGFHESYPVITLGPKLITNRHMFAFILSNTQYIDAAGIVANTYRINANDWVLGFHITREI